MGKVVNMAQKKREREMIQNMDIILAKMANLVNVLKFINVEIQEFVDKKERGEPLTIEEEARLGAFRDVFEVVTGQYKGPTS